MSSGMTTAEYRSLDPDLTKTLWVDVYVPAFERIRNCAPQRHVMWWEEFLPLCTDTNIIKAVTFDDDGRPTGLAFITNDLAAVPLIEPGFYETNWPDLYRKKMIWYLISICSRPDRSDAGSIYSELLTTLSRHVDGGISGMDFSSWNIHQRHLDRLAACILSAHLGRAIPLYAVGSQVYHIADLTEDGPR